MPSSAANRPHTGLAREVVTSAGLTVGAALLIVGFLIAWYTSMDGLPPGDVGQLLGLYVSLTLPPTSLFVFILAGLLAPPSPLAPFFVGLLLGLLDAALITILFASVGLVQAGVTPLGPEAVLPFWGIAPLIGMLVTGVVGTLVTRFAPWRRRKAPSIDAYAPARAYTVGYEPGVAPMPRPQELPPPPPPAAPGWHKPFAIVGLILTAWIAIVVGYALLTEWVTVDMFGVQIHCLRDPIFGGSWCRATGR